MEADLNTTNKVIYRNLMLQVVRDHWLTQEKIYSKQNRLAVNGTLVKVLFYNLICQTRLPAGISAVNVDNFYDRIAHPIASLVIQSLGVPKEACVSMLSTTILDMKFFLWTGFGDSIAFAGSTGKVKIQGMCQRKCSDPVAWTVTSITIIRAHKRKGHGIHL